MQTKAELRKIMATEKRKLSAQQCQAQAECVFSKLEQMPQFKQAKVVAAYWSLPDELNTHSFVERWCNSKTILLPIVVGNDLVFRQFAGEQNMQLGAFGILEPIGDEFKQLSAIDLIVVPGVAFDNKGNRMGRGRGFYDRTLSAVDCYKVGVAYSCQRVERVPTEPTDIAMDAVLFGE